MYIVVAQAKGLGHGMGDMVPVAVPIGIVHAFGDPDLVGFVAPGVGYVQGILNVGVRIRPREPRDGTGGVRVNVHQSGNNRGVGIVGVFLDRALSIAKLKVSIPIPTTAPTVPDPPIASRIVIAYNHYSVVGALISGASVNVPIKVAAIAWPHPHGNGQGADIHQRLFHGLRIRGDATGAVDVLQPALPISTSIGAGFVTAIASGVVCTTTATRAGA